jgi:cobalamin biosynthesis Mg chelatase CobN
MRNFAIALATVLALLATGSSAFASGRDVINDCTDDEVLSKTYTQKEYRDALAKLPADADQYGNCRDIIARAQESAATKGGSGTKKDNGTSSTGAPTGGGTPGSGTPATATPDPSSKPAAEQLAAATPDDRAAAAAAAKDAATPKISASDVAAAPGDSSSSLPTPVLVLLALLLAGALALAAVRVRSLVDTRRT